MQVISLIWGILSIAGLFVATMPCFGSLNWLNIPFSIAGLVVSILAGSKAPPGGRGGAIAGIVLCSLAILFGAIRLAIGGGIF